VRRYSSETSKRQYVFQEIGLRRVFWTEGISVETDNILEIGLQVSPRALKLRREMVWIAPLG
jgi:hypothetical protein